MKKITRATGVFVIVAVLLMPFRSHAVIGDAGAGWAQIPYFIKLVAENVKRYKQLKLMIEQAKNRDQYMKMINAGLENAIGLLDVLPIEDENILGTLKDFKMAYGTVQEVYGSVPKSKDSAMHMLHDQTAAEGIKMYNSLLGYVKSQEKNAHSLASQSKNASPKGAARMNVQVSAQILHTLNQLLKVNGHIVKMESEKFAMVNKSGKEGASAFNRVNRDIGNSLTFLRADFALTRF